MNKIVFLIFRLVHIFSGSLWVGVAIFGKVFPKNPIGSIEPDNAKFQESLKGRKRFSIFMGLITTSALISGFVLYFIISGGLSWVWLRTGPGIGFGVGAVAAVLAFFVGGFGISRASSKLGALSTESAGSTSDASPEVEKEIAALQKQLRNAENIDFFLLVISMAAMATARYW